MEGMPRKLQGNSIKSFLIWTENKKWVLKHHEIMKQLLGFMVFSGGMPMEYLLNLG